MNLLDKIINRKKEEVAERKHSVPLTELERSPHFRRETRSLSKALTQPGGTGIIAEFKRQSPSKGLINPGADLQSVTTAYAHHGAAGISVLTDTDFFGGRLQDLEDIRHLHLPVLRKEFIIDPYQLIESKAAGADVILLIAACLSSTEVKLLARQVKDLGMESILEIHNEEELDHICDEVDIIGVNNRNLKSFKVDVQTSFELVKRIGSERICITESGLSDVETVVSLRQAGYRGFLIGEHFMKQADPAVAFADFVQQLKAPRSTA
ncbi:MAG: indole-3-glycerol phosphate synthase TrpC [Flavisolibacter sp.]